jgi:deazaflavin-dependent oxidoreductase (nitroreductase family)
MGLGGLLGHNFVVMTTIGRKSGLPRHTMTEYAWINGRVVVASGWGAQAQWVKNLEADSHLTVQTAHGTQSCTAHRIDDDDLLTTVYQRMQSSPAFAPSLHTWGIEPPSLENLLQHKDRAYFFMCEPTTDPAPTPLETDLTWVWGVIGISFFVGWLAGQRK